MIIDYNGKVIPESIGTTMRIASKDYQYMSDDWQTGVFAYFWKNGRTEQVLIEGGAEAEVDITEEIFNEIFQQILKSRQENCLSNAEINAKEIYVGDVVKVIKGKHDIGKEGKVFKIITRPYNMGVKAEQRPKVGFALDDEMGDVVGSNGKTYRNYINVVWAWAHNCEKVGWKDSLNREEISAQAFKLAMGDISSMVSGNIKKYPA